MDEVDIDMGTGRILRQAGRNLINHGYQIEKEIPVTPCGIFLYRIAPPLPGIYYPQR